MKQAVRAGLSYANVVSTICLIVVLGGGAYAATRLDKDSVGSRQIIDGQVKTHDLRDGAVTRAKLGTALESRISDLEAAVESEQAATAELTGLLAGVSRESVGGYDTLRFSGMNVQLVNGEGSTNKTNGLGNLLIGYSHQRDPSGRAIRTGSHYLIVGDRNEWTGYGGIVAGDNNTAAAPYASVTGGYSNRALAQYATVSGGALNRAESWGSSASGGWGNSAVDRFASVSGGELNRAAGFFSSVLGGYDNSAGGQSSSILGGTGNSTSATNECLPACP